GIRDWSVTGVQTCALPISARTSTDPSSREESTLHGDDARPVAQARARDDGHARSAAAEVRAGVAHPRADGQRHLLLLLEPPRDRSEERRVGKERRARWAGY